MAGEAVWLHHGDSPRLGTAEPAGAASVPWEGSLGEAGQRGQQELIRATAAIGSSCRHPAPENRLSPPAPVRAASGLSPRGQWAQRPRYQERLHVKTPLPAASGPAGAGAWRGQLHPGRPKPARGLSGELGQGFGTVGVGAGRDARRGGGRWVLPPAPHAAPRPRRSMTAPPSPACGQSRVARGPGHERAAWGPAGGAAWARPAPPGTWAGLAFISGCGRSSEHKGTSWGTFPALPPRTPPPWGTWSAGAVWGVRTGAPRGPAGPTQEPRPSPPGFSSGRASPAAAPDTHAGTRGRPRRCRGPTAGPGRRAGSARSPRPWCCAGSGRPAGPRRPGRTRSRARCICTWAKSAEVGGLETGEGAAGGVGHREAPACRRPQFCGSVSELW